MAMTSLGAGHAAAAWNAGTALPEHGRRAIPPAPPEPSKAAERAAQLRALSHREASLEKRLQEEERRLAEEKKQHGAANVPAAPRQMPTAPAPDAPAVRSLRQQLQEARQRLADLESVDTDLHPDVIATKEQIKALQQQLRDAISSAPAAASAPPEQRPVKDNKPEQLTATMGREERQIAEDGRELGTLRVAMKVLQLTRQAALSRAPAASVAANRVLPSSPPSNTLQPTKPDSAASSLTPSPSIPTRPANIPVASVVKQSSSPMQPATATSRWASISIKALVGGVLCLLFFAGILVFLRKGRDRSIRDSATLRGMLPRDIDYVGSIPRMRAE